MWKTAGEVLQDAAVELGLAEPSNPFASTDASIRQLVRLLKSAGAELVRRHNWSHLQQAVSITTSAGVSTYEMPVDFNRHIDQTQWNRTTQFPLGGPISPQGWQLLKAVDAAATIAPFFRPVGRRIQFYPTPTAEEDVVLEYISNYWVQVELGGDIPDADQPTASDNILWFDAHLLTRALKVKWQEAKGFDSTAARNDYEVALSSVISGDGAAPVLRLDQQPLGRWRSIDALNLPDTGVGS